MIYENAEQGLQEILFPVQEVDVYAETEPGRRDKIPSKKALVNVDTRRVLSVVSDTYHLVLNKDALRLAERCCIAAFPNTAPANWRVFSVEAPRTGGHCRIDLTHKGVVPAYDWSFSKTAQDRHEPFIRVTNSYNGTRRLAIHFGLVRCKCTNGMVVWDSSAKLSFKHDETDIKRRIEREIDEAKFRNIIEEFRCQAMLLHAVPIPQPCFRPVILSVLRIRKPEGLPTDRQADWNWLEREIDLIAEKYVNEFGLNGEALANAITEVATHPPASGHRYSFIRRERHDRQRLVGIWVAEFGEGITRPDFNLVAYLDNPSSDRLQA